MQIARLSVVFLALLLGCSPPPTPYTAALPDEVQAQRVSATRLGPGDVFELRVFEEESLSGEHRVASDGTVRVPLIGRVTVEGLTPEEIADRVAIRLRDGFLRAPHVTVFVQEYNSKRVFVLGQVRKPGTFPFQDDMSIVQAITLAGGLTELSDADATVVTRDVDGEERRFIVPVEAITRGERANFALRPGDIVYVPKSIL